MIEKDLLYMMSAFTFGTFKYILMQILLRLKSECMTEYFCTVVLLLLLEHSKGQVRQTEVDVLSYFLTSVDMWYVSLCERLVLNHNNGDTNRKQGGISKQGSEDSWLFLVLQLPSHNGQEADEAIHLRHL